MVKDVKPIVNKGMDDDFGMYKNRPFYIVSKMPMGRVLTMRRDMECKLRDYTGGADQQFVFSGHTKSIKNRMTNFHLTTHPNVGYYLKTGNLRSVYG